MLTGAETERLRTLNRRFQGWEGEAQGQSMAACGGRRRQDTAPPGAPRRHAAPATLASGPGTHPCFWPPEPEQTCMD